MANLNHDQSLLSEQLLLLHKLDLDYPDDSALHDFIGEGMKPLNTIALLLSTGLPGEHFAAAFDKRLGLELVLAKNGTPTSEDIADAKELFSRLCSPEVRRGSDLYPFVARRCRANVVKRVQKLRASVIDTGFNDDFYSRLDQCSSACEPLSPSTIEREFPRGTDSIIEEYTDKSFSTISRDLLDSIIGGAVASEVPSLEKFFDIYISALALAHSRFLQQWVRLKDAGYQKVQRFQRCAAKLCRYINDVHSLIKHAKRLGPIKCRWVTDESLGIQAGAGDICVHAVTPEEALHRASVLSLQQLEGLKERKPFIVDPWQRTVHTYLHAELRIILYFGWVPGVDDRYQPIGLSKRSCLCCVLWIAEHNQRPGDGIWWETRSRNKPDPTWAFTACACSKVQDLDLRVFDEKVKSGVSRCLQGHLQPGCTSITELGLYELVADLKI